MKVKVKPQKVYSITYGNKTLGGWVESSRWEGMVKLIRKDGKSCIIEEPAPDFLSVLFGPRDGQPEETEVDVIRCHPSIIDELAEGEKEKE